MIETFLPAPAVQCHAANLLPLPGGELGCAWFSGTQEGMADIDVWFSRFAAGEWSPPVRVSDDPERSEQNPVLLVAPDGELRVLYTAQHAGNQDTAEVRVRTSPDGGRSWSAARTLIPARADGGVFVRQPVVALESGRLLLPAFRCPRPATGRWVGDEDSSAVFASDDGGRTWTEHEVPGSTGCVHMNIVPLDDGFAAFFRRRQADAVHLSRSRDGLEWTEPEPVPVPNNNSSIQAVRLRDGAIALVCNPVSVAQATARRTSLYDEIDGPQETGLAFWGAPRAPLSLLLSRDGGRSWPVRRDIETGDGHCLTNDSRGGGNRELSYPSIAQTADGVLHIAYTHHRRAIKHVRVDPAEIS